MSKPEEKKMSRRTYLQVAGGTVVGLAVGGALGYLAKPPEVRTVISTLTETVTVTGTAPPPPPPPALGKTEILIGGTLPLSGVAAGDAARFQHGMQMAVDKVNAEGGILGAKLKLVLYDDGFDPSKIASLYEVLITKDKVDLLVPSYGAPMTFPALAQAEKYDKIMVAGYTASQELSQKYGGRYYFSIDTQPSPNYSVWFYKGMSDFLWDFDKWNYKTDIPKPTKIAILNENQFWGIEQHKIWKPMVESQGWEVVVDEFVEMGQVEFSDILTKIRVNKPDVIFVEFFYFRAVMFVKQMYEQRVNANFVAISESGTGYDWCDPEKGVGPGLGNGIITFAYVPKTYHAGASDYLRTKSQELYGSKPGFLEAAGFAQVEVIGEAVKRAGSVSSDALRKTLLSEKFDTCYTAAKFDNEGTNTLFRPPVGQWINGDIEIVYPVDAATSKPVYPYSPTA